MLSLFAEEGNQDIMMGAGLLAVRHEKRKVSSGNQIMFEEIGNDPRFSACFRCYPIKRN
jgi:hypothetical protein